MYVEFQNKWNKKQAILEKLKKYNIVAPEEQVEKFTTEMDYKIGILPLNILQKLEKDLQNSDPKFQENKHQVMSKISTTSLVDFLWKKEDSDEDTHQLGKNNKKLNQYN